MILLEPERWTGRIFSDGWRPGSALRDVVSPVNGEQLGVAGLAGPEDIERAGLSATAAASTWAALPFSERAAVLERAAAILGEHREEIAAWAMRETGALRHKATHETELARGELRAAAALAAEPYGELLRGADAGQFSFARRVPVGVVGVIAPWNAPLMLAIRSVAPALALGNTVVLKPDAQVPVTGGVVIARVFEEAGLPPGALHVLPGGAATGEALVTSPHNALLCFTGSSATGRRIGELAGRLLKRTVLELGGNNAFIVLGDADLEAAVNNGLWGSLAHFGQICMATGRHLVHESIAADYTGLLTERVAKLRVGDPADPAVRIGPLINERQAERVHGIVTDTVAAGARLRTGGGLQGRYHDPTVLDRVGPDMRAFTEEIFGPVLPVTAFASDEEAVALAGAGEYALSGAVHTASVDRGLALAERLGTGMFHINGQPISDAPHVPMGGRGASGNGGRHGGHWNLEEFTDTQWVTVRTTPPSYPI